jgi:hypothetical protein
MDKLLIINEQHTLLPEQERVLREFGWAGATVKAPAAGWTSEQMVQIIDGLDDDTMLIFASPVAALMSMAAMAHVTFAVLHNDKREATEITAPDGSKKIIHRISATGWQII